MSLISKLRNTLNQKQINSDLADEIRDHIDRRAAQFEAAGMSADEARRRAAILFGGIASVQEQSREHRLWTTLDQIFSDIRYACRGLLRNPVFALTAIASLGLAIGANTAIYSIIDAAVLRPLPVPQPDRLFTLSSIVKGQEEDRFSYPRWLELSEAVGDSGRIGLFDSPVRAEAQTAPDGPPAEVTQQFVSPNAFDVLGLPPLVGRLFSPAEDRFPSPRAVAVLSHDYWQRGFGGDPGIVGKPLVLNGRRFSVLGVAAKGFTGPEPGKFVDVWLPVTQTDPGIFTNPNFRAFRLLRAPSQSRAFAIDPSWSIPARLASPYSIKLSPDRSQYYSR